jgi:hypothetical protein
MPRPEFVFRHSKPHCRLSIILLDWGVRESFHSLQYLNQQTTPRDKYEILWLEFYKHKPLKLQEMIFRQGNETPLIDQWLVAGYDKDTIFNKHRLYNLGILLAQGEICVICDSDAIFTPNFVTKVLEGFAQTPRAVIHLDEIRNEDRRFHPFAYPAIQDILGPGCINWQESVSTGLDNADDIIHAANYGACMAAARKDLLDIGGADEHLDYLGYICGPYDMTFRLVNHSLTERWLRDEYLYHVWHPNIGADNADYQGPSDGRGMSSRSLESRLIGRVQPCLENPWIRREREGTPLNADELLSALAEREEPAWKAGQQPAESDAVFMAEPDFHGFNLYRYRRHWYGLRVEDGYFDPQNTRRYRPLIDAKNIAELKHLVDYYNTLPKTWWGRLAHQPIYDLPWRAARKVGKELGRLLKR